MSQKVSQQEVQERANKLSQLLNRSKLVMEKSEIIDTKSIQHNPIQPSRKPLKEEYRPSKVVSDDYESMYDEIEYNSPEPFINPNQHGLQTENYNFNQNSTYIPNNFNQNSINVPYPQYIPEQPNENIREEVKKKLPKDILEIMEKTPIPKIDASAITGSVGVPLNVLNKSRDLQNRLDEKYEVRPQGNIKKGNIQKPTNLRDKEILNENRNNFNVDLSELKSMIKEIVYETINEVYEEKLIKEDINIKIGNTIFSGSLKPIKKIK
jgi:hypothetical protein